MPARLEPIARAPARPLGLPPPPGALPVLPPPPSLASTFARDGPHPEIQPTPPWAPAGGPLRPPAAMDVPMPPPTGAEAGLQMDQWPTQPLPEQPSPGAPQAGLPDPGPTWPSPMTHEQPPSLPQGAMPPESLLRSAQVMPLPSNYAPSVASKGSSQKRSGKGKPPLNGGKFCNVCGIWQPLRVKAGPLAFGSEAGGCGLHRCESPLCPAFIRPSLLPPQHCYDCGRCVYRFDHHCGWLGICVGRDNHALFLTFITSQLALSMWSTVQVRPLSAAGPGLPCR